ncbi:MAG TPA: HAD-IIA family hydrolase [Fimbriimonadaceae bacterium]|nr:HAD-IIA family hydrolase [Fimbriimonadaceae bacterium]
MKHYDAYLLDLDGTVYRGAEAVPGAAGFVARALDRGAAVRYLTNNSAAEPSAVAEKLMAMGVACEPGWVYGTGPLAVRECKIRGHRSVFVVGEPSLHEMFSQAGLSASEEPPDCVVVGICRSFTYALLERASAFVRGGADLIVTNRDATYPVEGGREQPGAGSIAAAVETASGLVTVALGKPAPALVEWALDGLGFPPSSALVVGDRYETDVQSGKAAGCDTLLVLTGVTRVAPSGQPSVRDLSELE